MAYKSKCQNLFSSIVSKHSPYPRIADSNSSFCCYCYSDQDKDLWHRLDEGLDRHKLLVKFGLGLPPAPVLLAETMVEHAHDPILRPHLTQEQRECLQSSAVHPLHPVPVNGTEQDGESGAHCGNRSVQSFLVSN